MKFHYLAVVALSLTNTYATEDKVSKEIAPTLPSTSTPNTNASFLTRSIGYLSSTFSGAAKSLYKSTSSILPVIVQGALQGGAAGLVGGQGIIQGAITGAIGSGIKAFTSAAAENTKSVKQGD